VPPDSDSQLPISEATFFILLSLATSSKHGYAIMKEVQAISDGRVSLSTGTLYGALKRMLDSGWIERFDEPDARQTGRARKAYRLTDKGRRLLEAETARMQRLVRAARRRPAGAEP
jgi:DNA-binding PadR family transcriptional regulator